ncbi:MAG TPA: hypothetical protein VEB40_03780, partial [Flavipsychrobacter sp.]|nr:hypothetical protein [Flavipsychrobacter sp.]
MKRSLLSISTAFLLLLGATSAIAQCDPVITPSSITMCPNTTDTLWSDAHDTYQWLENGMPIPGATSQYFVVDANLNGGSNISVVTTTTGCTGADTSADVYIDGWVFLLPYVINVTNTMLCPGVADSVMFDFSLDSNVQWFYNGSPIPGATNDTLVVYNTGQYSAEGAPDVCPNFIMQLGLNMSVDSNTPPVIAPDTLVLCPGTLGSLATTVLTYDSFQWYLDGNAILNSNTDTMWTSNAGHYHVVTDEDGCILGSDSSYAYIHTPTAPNIVLNQGTLYSVPGGSQLSNFQWYLNGNPISGANDSTYTPTVAGNYTVSAFDGTCPDTSAAFIFSVSVNEIIKRNDIRIYPNPVQDILNISSAEPVSVMIL